MQLLYFLLEKKVDTKLLEQLTIKLMKKNGVSIDIGAQYSVKCQYAQIENIIRDVINEIRSSALDDMQASYDTDMFNARGDGSQPLIDLDCAKCAVNDFLEI